MDYSHIMENDRYCFLESKFKLCSFRKATLCTVFKHDIFFFQIVVTFKSKTKEYNPTHGLAMEIVGIILGSVAYLLYVSSRFPQIISNVI